MSTAPAATSVRSRRSELSQFVSRYRRVLTVLSLVAAMGLALSVLKSTTGLGLPCLMKMTTGWDCPLCGGTRMGAALLNGEVGMAFTYNPALFVVAVLAGLIGLVIIVALAGGRLTQLADLTRRCSSKLSVSLTANAIAVVVLTLALAWVLVRNLIIGPL